MGYEFGTMESPIGIIGIRSRGDQLTRINLYGPNEDARGVGLRSAFQNDVGKQIEAYFACRLRAFDVRMDLEGAPEEHSIWNRLQRIPFGEMRTLRELEDRQWHDIFRQTRTNSRSYKAAIDANPVPLIIPSHRVSDHNWRFSTTGYADAYITRFLREHERSSARVSPTR